MARKLFCAIGLFVVTTCNALAQLNVPLFRNSYAIVVGINTYPSQKWPTLSYAVQDAKGFAAFLKSQRFEVVELYEERATKQAIVAAVEDRLVSKLTNADRVAFFFAGHGVTRTVAGDQRGYLVPYDGTESFASLLSMSQLHDFSAVMQAAQHQLFILDACFGGLIARGSTVIDPRAPNYVSELVKRRARQVLTAGGANQRVADGGPDGHSKFTGELLKALRDGFGDQNGDGYITFTELAAYITPAAAGYNQTPGVSELEGHQQGDFVFVNSTRPPTSKSQADSLTEAGGTFRSGAVDVYELLRVGKENFVKKSYTAAREPLAQAAEMGNAEAMVYLAKLYWDGLGGASDRARGLELERRAAEKGDTLAMQTLADLYEADGELQNFAEAKRWRSAAAEAEKLKQSLALVDPTGKADRGEPRIPARDVAILPAPTNLRVQ